MRCPIRDELGDTSMFDLPQEDTWNPTCSWCGSLNPDEFMRRAEAGDELGPTGKSYKVYVGARDKFCFQHLDEEQKKRFVELLVQGRLKIGAPGHFYVLPYFVRKKTATEMMKEAVDDGD